MTSGSSLLFLGTGGSMGVPIVGCGCAVCRSDDPRNKRLRPSVLVTYRGKRLLVDAGPDLRSQLLRAEVGAVDGLLITHAHNDHVAGIDDLRPLYIHRHAPLPLLTARETYENLSMRYAYIFGDSVLAAGLVPRFQVQLLPSEEGEVQFLDLPIGVVHYEQAGMKVSGFRFGSLAYLSDLSVFSESIFGHLKGVETLIISALKHTRSAFHLSIDEAVDFARRVNARKTWLMHIGHELDHEKTNSYLPDFIRIAYDGLELSFDA